MRRSQPCSWVEASTSSGVRTGCECFVGLNRLDYNPSSRRYGPGENPSNPPSPSGLFTAFPQALWAVALILCLSWFWRNQSLAWRIAVFVLASLAGIAPELAQLFEFAPGVYDHNDLLFCVAGTALAGVLVEWAIPIRPTIF